MKEPHLHRVRIYYEDTDLSGLVYHANYLRYMERAREHLFGADELVRLYYEQGVGFVVYKAELTYSEGARLGDELEIRSTVERESDFRLIFHQDVHHAVRGTRMVRGLIHLVCVDSAGKLIRVPEAVRTAIAARDQG